MSVDIQRKLLAELMLSSEAYDDFVLIAGKNDENVFMKPKNREVYRAIKTLAIQGESVSVDTVTAILDSQGKLTYVGGSREIALLSSEAVTAVDIRTTARLAVEAYHKNRLSILGDRLTKAAKNGHDVFDLAEKTIIEAQKVLDFGTDEHTETLESVVERVVSGYEEMKKTGNTRRIKTRIVNLDKEIGGGFIRGNYIVIGARPGTGKSNAGFNLALNLCQEVKVGFISAEMDRQSAAERLLAILGGFDDSRLVNNKMTTDDEQRLYYAQERIKKGRIVINDKPALSANAVAPMIRRWKREYGIEVVIVDYLQLLTAITKKGRTRENEVSEISKALDQVAAETKMTVIALAQLSRHHERSRELPKLSDLRESGSIEQDADMVIFLHSFDSVKDAVIPQNFGPYSGLPSKDVLLFIVEKNRRGPRGVIAFVHFDKRTGLMTSLDIAHDKPITDSTQLPF